MTRNLNTKQSSAIKQYSNETVYTILFFISFAHLLNDLIQGIISSIYPILKQNYGFTFSEIGLITFAFQLTASILQPFIGYYTDKYPKPYSQVYGMGFTALGIIILSFANNLNWIIVSSIIIGIGSAIFHTESGRISNLASGGKLGLAQSIFQTGGNLGSALAPLAVAFIVIPNSQKYLLWFFTVSTIGIGVHSRIAKWYKIHLNEKNNKKNIVESNHKLSKNKVKCPDFKSGLILHIILFNCIFVLQNNLHLKRSLLMNNLTIQKENKLSELISNQFISNSFLMKTKTSISNILLLVGTIIYGQDKKQNPLKGSWIGKTNPNDLSLSELAPKESFKFYDC